MGQNITEFRTKWNIPIWLEAEAYPNPHDLSDTLWRWEFLRRRSDYRQDWENHYQQTYDFEIACSKDPTYPTRYGKNVPPPDDPKFRAKMPNSLEKYHLISLPNPTVRKPWMLSFDSTYGRIYFGHGPDWLAGGEEVSLCLPEWKVAAVFDLKKPLHSQIEKVKKDLAEWQTYQTDKKIERRKSRDQWPLYLRVLDAVGEDVAYDEIGMKLQGIADKEEAEARARQLYNSASQLGLHFPN